MYIRFALIKRDEHSGCGEGIFTAAYDLRNSHYTDPRLKNRIRKLLRWFHHNLDAPEEFHTLSVFWFKADAEEMIKKIWELVNLLREGGCEVRQIRCKRPGKILYEDEHQVATIPFRDIRSEL